MSNKILVTGGTGYIGSHTVVELQNKGFDVVVIDNLSNSKIEILTQIEKITGKAPEFANIDLKEKELVFDFFRKNPELSGVIHFAAYKAVGESMDFPMKYYQNNLLSLMNLINGMLNYNTSNLVFSSSCTVYGNPDNLPIDEKAPVKPPISPYGSTKQVCENIIKDNVNSTFLKGISLRYFNPVGAHNSGLIGELPLGVPNNLVPFITQTAIGKRDTLKVFGDDYPTPDGTCIRDYIHVEDLAKAHVVAVERMLEGKQKEDYEIFNLGKGIGNSVFEIIRAFEKVSEKKLPYKIAQRRPGDVPAVWADTQKANEELEWKAERDLNDMLLSAWVWEKKLKEGKVKI